MGFGYSELAAIRLGFGLSPLLPPPADLAAVLAAPAVAGPGPEAITSATALQLAQQFRQANQARREMGEAGQPRYIELRDQLTRMGFDDLRRRVIRATDDPLGFGERLVQFWADHFTVRAMGAVNIPITLAFPDEAIRPHLNGRFEDMLLAADTHPAMLLYLDQTASRGPNSPFVRKRPDRNLGLNENLAREVLELHTLGVGAGYDQRDVRELAELLTGLTFSHKDGFGFNAAVAEPGAETVLGKAYGGQRRGGLDDINAALRDIARHPDTARHLSRKLAVHFMSDNPPEGVVAALTAAWRDSGGDLAQVYRALASHADLASTRGQKVRQPFELVVAGLRALGITGSQVAALDAAAFRRAIWNPIEAMGQPWGRPRGPDGWPEAAEAWITPQALAARVNWSLRVPRQLLDRLPDPRQMLETTFGGSQSEPLAWAVPKAESAAEGVALILASGDFNRR